MSGNETVKCTDEELEEFLKNARPIIIQQYPAPDDVNDMTDIAGIVSYKYYMAWKLSIYPSASCTA